MNRKDRLLVVGKNSKIQYKDGDNGMLLLTGTPGCGKSFYVVTPNIINNCFPYF